MSEIQTKHKKRLKFNQYAMNKAYERFERAIEDNDDNKVYASIGELLLWTISTEEWHKAHGDVRYKNRKDNSENGVLLYGIRFAYNAVKHNMSFIQISQKQGGFTFPITFPLSFGPIDIIWADNTNIEKMKDESSKQRQNYINRFEKKVVLDTFNQVFTFLKEENKSYIQKL